MDGHYSERKKNINDKLFPFIQNSQTTKNSISLNSVSKIKNNFIN